MFEARRRLTDQKEPGHLQSEKGAARTRAERPSSAVHDSGKKLLREAEAIVESKFFGI